MKLVQYMFITHFNDLIKDYRNKLGESRRDFSYRYGWSESSIQSYETYYDIPINKALILGHDMGMCDYFIHVTMRKTPKPKKDFDCVIIGDKDTVCKKIDYNYRITTSGEFYNRCFNDDLYGKNIVAPEIIASFEIIGINKDQCFKILRNSFYIDEEDIGDSGVSIENAIKICKLLRLPFTSAFVLLPKNKNYFHDKEVGNLAYSMDQFIVDETKVKFTFDKIPIDISNKEASILMDVLTSLRKHDK